MISFGPGFRPHLRGGKIILPSTHSLKVNAQSVADLYGVPLRGPVVPSFPFLFRGGRGHDFGCIHSMPRYWASVSARDMDGSLRDGVESGNSSIGLCAVRAGTDNDLCYGI